MSQVAKIIADQIGTRAFAMMGARKGARAGSESLTFNIGSNPKKVTTISVSLMQNDTYTVQFLYVRGATVKLIAQVPDVTVETLHATLAANTGLAMSLTESGGA